MMIVTLVIGIAYAIIEVVWAVTVDVSKRVMIVKDDGECSSASDFDEDTLALLAADHAGSEQHFEEHINATEADRYESLIVQRIGDVDQCAVYISLAPGMENPAGVDPPKDDAARCARYTSSEEEQNDPAPTTEDRVAGKRPLAADPSPAEALPAESSQAPKRRRLVWITDDNDEEEEAAPSLVRRPRNRPDVAPATTGRVTSDPSAPHAGPTAASDVDPDHVAGQRAVEPVAAVGDAAPQTTEPPAATTAATSAEEQPAPASAMASTPTRNEEAARTPPPRNVVEEESRAPTPPPAEERGVPTPP
ncbi:predicted GPI-anchored protein 58 [Sorghum bicolor]|uniref:predicted GPI-anchored protein 58 n=1 Tax=Sorghum bicolor TaxID=4558 RepID=UPI000B424C8A|nr:predicted GPI-anchored protein 58 [Sorghum bicolor]|eukprot:XP_021317725.1 predicted GPI-anchored protein 58 [Sorghum bicolor]